ncbi:flavodoxin family protein [Clostridium sp.]|uniref:flavodoxin family protein n=1 Tax=Clostridium sp. TaxID=1506 RepID=UPI002FC72FFC
MKTLIINGSPRKQGDTMTLINEMTKYLEGEVKILHTYYDNINPCVDCRYCSSNSGCSINDGMQEIYEYLKVADNVILASPLYFSELTGELLSFASRLQLFYASKYIRKDDKINMKKKKGVLIISAGGSTKDLEHPTKTANIIFRSMNVDSIGNVYAENTDRTPAKEDLKALSEVRELALKLNDLSKHQ